MKKLVRSKTNKVISGILGGIGEYLDIDPVIVRIIYVALMLITGIVPLIVAYIIALFIVPKPVQEM